jgi:hypothetical protein
MSVGWSISWWLPLLGYVKYHASDSCKSFSIVVSIAIAITIATVVSMAIVASIANEIAHRWLTASLWPE